MPADEHPFTSRGRRKRTRQKTRWSVRLADMLAERLITIGGIGTIVAVCLVFVFLFVVVAPLFQSAVVSGERQQNAIWVPSEQPLRVDVDEYRTVGWGLRDDGTLVVFRLDTGEILERRSLFSGAPITAISGVIGRDDLAVAFADGTLRFGKIGFSTEFRDLSEVPPELAGMQAGQTTALEDGIVQRTPQGQFRLQTVRSEFRAALRVSHTAVRALDHLPPDGGGNPLASQEYRFVALDDEGTLHVGTASEKKDLFSEVGELEISRSVMLPVPRPTDPSTSFLLLGARGDHVYLAAADGLVTRYDTRDLADAAIAEQVRVLPDDGSRLTAFEFLIGRGTLLCGDSRGRLGAWFRTRRKDASPKDGFELTLAHQLPPGDSAVTAVDSSKRSRMVGVGYASGRFRVFHVTTRQLMFEQAVSADRPVEHVLIPPKNDGLLVFTATQWWRADFDPKHPEATLAALFTPVWYEGYSEPIHMWQSSFSGVGPEMKLGLWPLVFGTLKATAYTMMLGAPLALLAALYTSEFLSTSWRSRVKPAVEMMAGLPSVVLGFLAALVFAPYAEAVVPAMLALFVTLPLSFLAGALLWQLLPARPQRALSRYRFAFLCLLAPAGFLAAFYAGPWLEQFLFAGDIKRWLDSQIGTGTGAWLLLLLPATALAMTLSVGLWINPRMRRLCGHLPRGRFALVNTLKTATATIFTFLAAYLLSSLLTTLGTLLDVPLDPRGTYVAAYEQRNALIVGFVMGFAVIPIIYTLADDALTSVPVDLRSASLGCGATPWQTAVRVVIPTAMSGLFSALMIGLGRAVGETMIVLMAGGNTPITDWNMFNGFRTLSANIAVELPEAVRDSTHYRTLFLAALTLFLMTFLVNTAAEIARLRFRRRAHPL